VIKLVGWVMVLVSSGAMMIFLRCVLMPQRTGNLVGILTDMLLLSPHKWGVGRVNLLVLTITSMAKFLMLLILIMSL